MFESSCSPLATWYRRRDIEPRQTEAADRPGLLLATQDNTIAAIIIIIDVF
jgi:hypothetical protein